MAQRLRASARSTVETLASPGGAAGAAALGATVAAATLLADALGADPGGPWLLWAAAALPAAVLVGVGVVALASATDLAPEGTVLDALLDTLGVAATLVAIGVCAAVGTVILIAPGLATLVLSVYAVPMVVAERTSPVTAAVESGRLAVNDPHQAIPIAGAAVGGLVVSAAVGVGATRALRTSAPEVGALAVGGALAGVGAAAVVVFLTEAYLSIDRDDAE